MKNRNRSLVSAICAGLGVGLFSMYFLDPDRGRSRRALVRDRALHTRRAAGRSLKVNARDVTNRLHGVLAKVQGRLRASKEMPDNDVLVSRVRSRIGRQTELRGTHLDVKANEGIVTLEGEMDASRIPALIACAAAVRGVRAIDNRIRSARDSVAPSVM